MQKHFSPPCSLSLLILIFSLQSLSLTSFSQSPNPISPSSACKSALYPKLCRTIISAFRSSPAKNPYGYGQFSVKQCLKQAKKLTEVISHLLTHDQRLRLSHLEAGALDDCRQLFELNVDYLETINGELDSAEIASDRLVDRVLTLLSGIVTNQVTCYDGLASSGSGLASVLYAPLSDASELYSVSLGLVSHALGRTRGQKSRSRALTTQLHWVHELTWTLNKVRLSPYQSLI
ncbi:Pectinesterase inhibitor domain [Dillenia turbinata]|uniref:Pectinesterase inhibitor domain n=1 Tax=Dillenia turbinata TaxID=194707 RepID=A0AAN8VQY0_9MAGN